jgi:hypothetical protein
MVSDNSFVCRDECMCNPVRFFAIISSQRSGSGWFETLLNSHINVSSNGEIFSNKQRRSNTSSIIKTLDKVYNLDWNSSASKNECTAAVGMKWMLNQVSTKVYNLTLCFTYWMCKPLKGIPRSQLDARHQFFTCMPLACIESQGLN